MPRLHKTKPSNSQMWITFAIAAVILSAIAVSSNYANVTGMQFGGCTYNLGAISDLAASSSTANSVTLTWTAPTYTAFGSGCNPAGPTYLTANGGGVGHTTSDAITTDADFDAGTTTRIDGPNYAVGTQTKTVSGLQKCTQYYFAVRAAYQGIKKLSSSSPSKYTQGEPSVPRSLAADTTTAGKVKLTWISPNTLCGLTVNTYQIYRDTTQGFQIGDSTKIATVNGNTLSYDDSTVDQSGQTTYYYQVTATTNGGTSFSAAIGPVTPQSSFTAPSAPTLLSVTAADKKVDLTWSAPASNGGAAITSQKIYRGTQSGVLSLVKTFNDGTTTTYSDTGLTNDQVYYYKISAVNSVGEGTKSNEMSGTPFLPSPTKCSDGSDYGQCSSNKPKYCDNGNLVDNATVCLCPSGQTASGNACIAAPTTPTTPTEPTTPTDTTQPTDTTTPTDTDTTGNLEQPESFDVLEGKARSSINVAESAIRVAKDDKKDVSNATKLYNEAVSSYNSAEYQTAIDKAKAATDAALQAKVTQPTAELPVTAIVALLVVIAVGGGVVYYYKNIYKKAQGATPQTEPQTPTQRR